MFIGKKLTQTACLPVDFLGCTLSYLDAIAMSNGSILRFLLQNPAPAVTFTNALPGYTYGQLPGTDMWVARKRVEQEGFECWWGFKLVYPGKSHREFWQHRGLKSLDLGAFENMDPRTLKLAAYAALEVQLRSRCRWCRRATCDLGN